MALIESELQALAGLRSERDPIVSVYLNTRWSDEHQRERVRLFVRDKLRWARARGQAADRPAFERTLERIERHVEGLCRQAFDESADGVAIFACEAIGLWRTYEFERRLRNEFTLGPIPHLLQLARYAYDYQPVVVAKVDARGARVFETALGAVMGETRIAHEAQERHSMGGWSQFRFQRHVDQQVERNHEEAATHVAFLLDQDPKSQLILVGTDRTIAAFERVLPARFRSRILARQAGPGIRRGRDGINRDRVISGAVDEVLAHERSLEVRDVHAVVGEALAGGLAELGPEDVVLAANEGRIHRLLVEDGFDQVGWRCRQCTALGIKTVRQCTFCGGEVDEVPLGEQLARRVLAAGGEVDVLEPQPLLHHYYGIAAVLRHRGARAAIGAAEEPLAY